MNQQQHTNLPLFTETNPSNHNSNILPLFSFNPFTINAISQFLHFHSVPTHIIPQIITPIIILSLSLKFQKLECSSNITFSISSPSIQSLNTFNSHESLYDHINYFFVIFKFQNPNYSFIFPFSISSLSIQLLNSFIITQFQLTPILISSSIIFSLSSSSKATIILPLSRF